MIADTVKEILENLSESQLYKAYMSYCEGVNESLVFTMDMFDEIVDTSRPYKEVKAQLASDFDENDEYFYFSDNGYYESTSDLISLIDFDDMAQTMVDKEEAYDIHEIEEIFDGTTFEEKFEKEFKELDEELKKYIFEQLKVDNYDDLIEVVYDKRNDELKNIFPETMGYVFDDYKGE